MTTAILLVPMLLVNSLATANDAHSQRQLSRLSDQMKQAGRQGIIVGAQIAVGNSTAAPETVSLGATAPGSGQAVNDDTMFCIGSCSKPFAAVCILALSEGNDVDLDTPVDTWVPQMATVVTTKGQTVPQAPTLRQLLAHRGGIYSQKQGPMTSEQKRAIRDFELSLSESAGIISQEPLISLPGESYAYSGAGYCLAGYAAVQATGSSFEELLQAKIGQPLALTRTTFFPQPDENNIAQPGRKGSRGATIPHPGAPHLLKTHLRLPLIGGSLYSTATETAQFARMILNEGRIGRQRLLSERAWQELTKQQFDNQGYGLGWGLTIKNQQVIAMKHTGSLLGYRSLIAINVAADQYIVVHWTQSSPNDPRADRFRDQLEKATFGHPSSR